MNAYKQPTLSLLLSATLLVGLSGCKAGLYDIAVSEPDETVVLRVTCPVLKTYPVAYQKETAAELRVAGPRVKELVNDYIALRDACRSLGLGKKAGDNLAPGQ